MASRNSTNPGPLLQTILTNTTRAIMVATTARSAASNVRIPRYCDRWYYNIGYSMELPVYLVLPWILMPLGFLVRCVCLVAFYRQAKKEKAYIYQIFLFVLDAAGIFVGFGYFIMAIYVYTFNTSRLRTGARSYALYWYAAYLAIPLTEMFSTSFLLLACFMAADRFAALHTPFKQVTRNRTKNFVVALCVTVIVSVAINLYGCFRVVPAATRSGTYELLTNSDFAGSKLGDLLVWLCNTTKIVAILILIVLNVLVVGLVVRQGKNKRRILSDALEENKKRDAIRKEINLGILAVSECFFITITSIMNAAYFVADFTVDGFEECEAQFWGAMSDVGVLLFREGGLYVALLINRRLRKLIVEHVPGFHRLRC